MTSIKVPTDFQPWQSTNIASLFITVERGTEPCPNNTVVLPYTSLWFQLNSVERGLHWQNQTQGLWGRFSSQFRKFSVHFI